MKWAMIQPTPLSKKWHGPCFPVSPTRKNLSGSSTIGCHQFSTTTTDALVKHSLLNLTCLSPGKVNRLMTISTHMLILLLKQGIWTTKPRLSRCPLASNLRYGIVTMIAKHLATALFSMVGEIMMVLASNAKKFPMLGRIKRQRGNSAAILVLDISR